MAQYWLSWYQWMWPVEWVWGRAGPFPCFYSPKPMRAMYDDCMAWASRNSKSERKSTYSSEALELDGECLSIYRCIGNTRMHCIRGTALSLSQSFALSLSIYIYIYFSFFYISLHLSLFISLYPSRSHFFFLFKPNDFICSPRVAILVEVAFEIFSFQAGRIGLLVLFIYIYYLALSFSLQQQKS